MLLLDDAAVELVAREFLLLEQRVAPRLEGGETLVEAAGAATVEPNGRARQVGEQAAVVADDREGGARFGHASHSSSARSSSARLSA